MSLIYVATGAAVVGDATDFLNLGPRPAVEASQSFQDRDGGPIVTAAQLTDQDPVDQGDDDPSDTRCVDQIRIDSGEGSRIELLGQRAAPFPNARTEYYSASTRGGLLRYACTIVLPDQISLARLGSRPADAGTSTGTATRRGSVAARASSAGKR
jgi:hypothetical protein